MGAKGRLVRNRIALLAIGAYIGACWALRAKHEILGH